LDKNTLIQKLKWFYVLELNQAELYTAQRKKVTDRYLQKVLEHLAEIEYQHVGNIVKLLKDLGAKPAGVTDLLGPIFGKIGGQLMPLAGLTNMFTANVLLEQKAITDYKDLIKQVKDSNQELAALLWSHLVDEDLHAAWFARKAQKLRENNN